MIAALCGCRAHGRLACASEPSVIRVDSRGARASHFCLTGFILLLATAAGAQTGITGMKKEIVGGHAAGGPTLGAMALVQMLIALAVVFVLIRYLLPKVAARAGRRLVAKVGSPIKVEESAAFGGGMLYVVEVRDKTLLLSVGSQGVSCLADLTPSLPRPEPTQTFHEMLEESPAVPAAQFTAVTPVSEEPEAPAQQMSETDARRALERLRKIVD